MGSRIIYFDAPAGGSGDMFVGALLDAGADFTSLKNQLMSLDLHGLDVRASKVVRGGISGTSFKVLDPNSEKPVEEEAHGHHHRGMTEITGILTKSQLPPKVIEDSLAVFTLLAKAEAKVHNTSLEKVHFHEVGALDAIADIVSASLAFRELDVERAVCSPINVGSGTVRCSHGVLPVPAPATLELLRGVPVYSDGTKGELCTPTGAALFRHFCDEFSPMPAMVVERVGYGAGSKDFSIPNFLRAAIGSPYKDSDRR